MADKIPVKAILTEGNTSALGEFNPGDTLGVTFGGTGADNAASARTNLGLGNVDNTSDLAKPVSIAQADADTAVLNAAALDATTKANAAEADAIAASTPIAHVGSTGTSHGVATNAVDGFMSSADKIKLDAVLGTNTGDQTNITGNAGTATKLQTARNINGVSFDGSADITVADSTKAVKGANSDITSLSGLTTALTVAQGGTGRNTGATAYGLVAAGTTATGAQQTLAAGLTTQMLVGGGTSALPVWTAATGSGSPVRATSPTLVTPNIGVATGTSFNSITGLSSTTPVMNGAAAIGTNTTTARGDHVHPTDTSRAPLASPTFTGPVTAQQYFNVTQPYGALQVGGVDVMRFGSDNSGQLAGFRNKIINGGFAVNQRGYISGAAVGANLYAHDRWKMAASADTYTFATTANKTTVTIPAGKVLRQVIEGLNLQTGTYTLSWEGTAQGKIGAGVLSASGVTGSITGGADTTIEFGPGTVANAQLEFGTIATPFEQRPIGLELSLCQRYYQKDMCHANVAAYNMGAVRTQGYRWPTMRVAPTMTLLQFTNAESGAVAVADSFLGLSPEGFAVLSVVSGVVAGSYYNISTARSAEL